MKYVFLICVLVLAVSLQLSVIERLDFFSAVPDIIVAAVIGYALSKSGQKNHWLVLIAAFFYDLAVGKIFGVLLFDLWISFFLIDWLGRSFFKRNDIGAAIFLAFFGAVFFGGFRLVLFKLVEVFHLAGLAEFNASGFYWPVFFGAILNGFLALIFLFLINRYFKFDGSITQFKPKT